MRKFSVAGIASDKKGNTKVRYANDLTTRIKKLSKDNFTNINFVELPQEMTKHEVCEYLLTLTEFSHYKNIIQDELDRIVQSEEALTIIKKRKLVRTNIDVNDILNAVQ